MLSRVSSTLAAASSRAMSTAAALPTFTTLALTLVSDGVVEVKLNRPDKSNAMNRQMWHDIGAAFSAIGDADFPARAVILSGAGRNFTSGLDLMDHVDMFTSSGSDSGDADPARRALRLRATIRAYQASLSSIEACPKPVIAAIHGACVGGGVDMVCAADIRYASVDAWFSIKEAEIGLAADVGTLQRLPKVCRSCLAAAGVQPAICMYSRVRENVIWCAFTCAPCCPVAPRRLLVMTPLYASSHTQRVVWVRTRLRPAACCRSSPRTRTNWRSTRSRRRSASRS